MDLGGLGLKELALLPRTRWFLRTATARLPSANNVVFFWPSVDDDSGGLTIRRVNEY